MAKNTTQSETTSPETRLPTNRLFLAGIVVLLLVGMVWIASRGTAPINRFFNAAPETNSPLDESPQIEAPVRDIPNTPAVPPLQTTATQTATPLPLSLVFPTPGKAPISAWRPPLYPVPWSPTPNDHFFFHRPIYADVVNWPSGNYRYGGVFFENVVHSGIDIAASHGTPIIAAGPGKIVWAGYGLFTGIENPNDPYGLAVVIRHDFGYQGENIYTLYGHMSQIDVTKGQTVQTGDQLGLVGDTGFTTGPHLHFEVRVGENIFFATYNPELWLAPPQGWGLLAARIMGTGGQLLQNYDVRVINLDTDQKWTVTTYGSKAGLNSDPYYRENMVIGDLPAGYYRLEINYLGQTHWAETPLAAGQVTYFTYQGKNGFQIGYPPTPEPAFTSPVSPTPTTEITPTP